MTFQLKMIKVHSLKDVCGVYSCLSSLETQEAAAPYTDTYYVRGCAVGSWCAYQQVLHTHTPQTHISLYIKTTNLPHIR